MRATGWGTINNPTLLVTQSKQVKIIPKRINTESVRNLLFLFFFSLPREICKKISAASNINAEK